MALFKIYRGNETSLPAAMNDGWAYFCTDSGNFYIDWDNDGVLARTQINANYASNLKYLDGEEYAEIDATTLIQGFTTMWSKITELEGSAITDFEIDEICGGLDEGIILASTDAEELLATLI